MARLFGDTYALIELLKGNPSYDRYSNADLVTTEFNMLELTYALLRDFGRHENSKCHRFREKKNRSHSYGGLGLSGRIRIQIIRK